MSHLIAMHLLIASSCLPGCAARRAQLHRYGLTPPSCLVCEHENETTGLPTVLFTSLPKGHILNAFNCRPASRQIHRRPVLKEVVDGSGWSLPTPPMGKAYLVCIHTKMAVLLLWRALPRIGLPF